MKLRTPKTAIKETKQRGTFALLLVTCLLWLAAVTVAQVGTPSRVTGLQLGDTAEGSRVTILANTALGDYEAFRRGDRFYVKIPMADLATAVPTFKAAGFDDMQVQKQGSSIMISFKLQPGATARVDQRGTRLEVIFSSPGRFGANVSGSNRSLQPTRDRGSDAAGPMPQDIPFAASRTGVVGNQNASMDDNRFSRSVSPQGSRTSSSSKNSNVASTGLTAGSPGSNSPSPASSPSSILSPGNSNSYASLSSSTPTTTVAGSTSNPAGTNTGVGWRNRFESVKRWVLANKLATLLGAVILVSLVIYLVLAMRSRKQNGYKARSAKTPKVQPTYRAGEELGEASPASALANEAPAPRQEAARSAAAAPGANTGRVLTKPTVVSTPVAPAERNNEQEDREVFEL